MKKPMAGKAEKMGKAGYTQGEMEPHVHDMQKPMNDYSQAGFSKTDEYIERQNRFQAKEASEIRTQDYKGRYS